MNYTTKTDEKGNTTLLINGVEAICPYKPDITVPVQNAFGQMQMSIVKTACSTNCPFADYVSAENVKQYSIECAGFFKAFDIDNEIDENENKIIYSKFNQND